MPAKEAKSALFSKLGARLAKAHAAVKDIPAQHDQGARLPPDINGGVAQLEDIKFDIIKTGDNEGMPCFSARGVVKAPPFAPDGTPIVGLHTRIGPEPLGDTKARFKGQRESFEDHWGWMVNQLKLLGVDVESIEAGPPAQIEAAYVSAMEALKIAQPYFRFRTWRMPKTADNPDPRTNETWDGICDWRPEARAGANDRSGQAGPAGSNGEKTFGAGEAPGAAVEGTAEAGFDEFGDLDSLAAKADAGDSVAQGELEDLAEKLGIGDEAKEAENWVAVVEMIRAAHTGEEGGAEGGEVEAEAEVEPEEEAEPEPEEYEPEKGDLVTFSPPDPKKAGKYLKPRTCEVVVVGRRAKTVDVRDKADAKKVWKGQPWEAVVKVEE